MGELLSHVLPLALGSAISPVLLTVLLLVLSGPSPRTRGLAVCLGAAAVLVVVGIASLILFSHTVSKHDAGHGERSAIIDLALGAVLLGLGVRGLVTPAKPKQKPPHSQESGSGPEFGRYFALGLGMMAVNATTLVLYIDAVKETARARVGDLAEIGTLAVLIAFATLPATAPLIAYSIAPDWASRSLSRLNAFIGRHTRTITVAVCWAFGAYLVIKGATGL